MPLKVAPRPLGNVRRFTLMRGAWMLTILLPFALLLLIGWFADRLPSLTAADACRPVQPGALALAPAPGGGLTVNASPPTAPSLSFPACNAKLPQATAALRAGLERAEFFARLAFTLGALSAVLVGVYAVFTVWGVLGGHDPGGTSDLRGVLAAGLFLVAAIALGAVVNGAMPGWFELPWRWLPHEQTLVIMRLLDFKTGGSEGAVALVRWGCFIALVIAHLYVGAMAALACGRGLPDPRLTRLDEAAADAGLEELFRRMQRLTTLSYVGSLGFGLALLALYALLQWPMTLPDLGTPVGDVAQAIVALFGVYLTASLIGGYLPAATILENRAERLVLQRNPEASLAERRKLLADSGLTVVTTARLTAALATLVPLLTGSLGSFSSAASLTARLGP